MIKKLFFETKISIWFGNKYKKYKKKKLDFTT